MKERLATLQAELEKYGKRREKYQELRERIDFLEEKATGSIRIILFFIWVIEWQQEYLLPKRVIAAKDVPDFFDWAVRQYDSLQERLNHHLTYSWFCLWLSVRYSLRSKRGGTSGGDLSPDTVLSYFKRARASG